MTQLKIKAASEEATIRYEIIVQRMNEEIVRFKDEMKNDIGIAFHEFAKRQTRLADGFADAWRSLLPKLGSVGLLYWVLICLICN